jgi:predicted DNA-binding transcriptional regulator AlpA
MSEVWKTIKDYAESQSVSVKTIYNRIKAGTIPKDRVKKILGVTLVKV